MDRQENLPVVIPVFRDVSWTQAASVPFPVNRAGRSRRFPPGRKTAIPSVSAGFVPSAARLQCNLRGAGDEESVQGGRNLVIMKTGLL